MIFPNASNISLRFSGGKGERREVGTAMPFTHHCFQWAVALCIAHVMVKWRSSIFQRKNDINTTAGCSSLTFWYEMFYKKLAFTHKNKTFNLLLGGEQVFTVPQGPNSLFNSILDPACYKNNPEWFKIYQIVFKNREEIRYSVFSHTPVFRKSNPMLTKWRRPFWFIFSRQDL